MSCKVTCSFCSSWRRRRSWRLSPACPLSPWSFRLPRKPVCRLLWIRCFPCSLLWGVAPCSDFCLSRVVCRFARGFILRFAGELFPHATFRRQAFISDRSVRRVQRKTNFRPLTREYCLAPSCGFPQKPFPPAGPHGFRGHLRRSGMRASEDGASAAPPCYAACNAPAKRSDGALPTHYRPALDTHPVAADFQEAASRL